ncbi:GAF domain-containing protein [Mesorhizobium sp. M0663]|uniref:GAF domain-containing protein n=1 Tax=unclassified Mesorhizobium TaxID=325217 RepID=UPI00333DDC1E
MVDSSQFQADLVRRYLGIQPRTSEDQVLRLTVETGVRAVGADEGSLLVFDPERNDLTFVMTYGNAESEAALIGRRVPIGESLMGLAAETGEVQLGAPRFKDPDHTQALDGVKAVIAAPMMIGERLIGVITAISNKDGKRFTMDDAELYACLATIAALMLNQSLVLRSLSHGSAMDDVQPASFAGEPLEQEILQRVARLLQRDRTVVREVARVLKAIEAMSLRARTDD